MSPASDMLLPKSNALSARPDPKGGSYLPLLTIEVLNPRTIDLEAASGGNTGSTPQIVQ